MESLNLIMTTLQAKITEETNLLIRGIRSKIGKNGELVNKETTNRIKTLMDFFIKII